MRTLLTAHPVLAYWWAMPTEAWSALCRREREGRLDATGFRAASSHLLSLVAQGQEVAPSEDVRETAARLLRVHSLRAADALQLAAFLVLSGHRPSTHEFVCLDDRLRDAATREGAVVLP